MRHREDCVFKRMIKKNSLQLHVLKSVGKLDLIKKVLSFLAGQQPEALLSVKAYFTLAKETSLN